MARFDRDKTLSKTDGHFDLILMAAHRAKEIQKGSPTLLEEKYHSPAVSALKEIQEDLYTKEKYESRHTEGLFDDED